MVSSPKTLGVNLIDVLSPRRSSRKPSTRRNHFDAADWRAIARRCSKNLLNSLPGEFRNLQMFRGELFKNSLFFHRRRRLDAFIDRVAKFADELAIKLSRIPLRRGGNLGRHHTSNDPVLFPCLT